MDGELRWWFTLGIPLLSVMDFQRCRFYTGAYPPHRWRFLSGCCLALRHSQFASSLGLWCHLDYDGLAVVGWPYTRGVALSDSVFIGDTVTLLDILHWDTFYSLMVDFSRWWLILRHDCFRDCACIEGWHWPYSEDTYWGIAVSLVMDFDCSLEHSHFSWFILGHSHHIHIHGARGFWFIWITLRCFCFGTRGRGWLICWLGYTTLHWGIAGMESIFWSIATLFGSFTLGHVHLLEGDQIGSWHWSIWRVIWRSLDYFMLFPLHTGA